MRKRLKASYLLKASCLWALFVWGTLIKNMITDQEHELAFRLVHISIAVVSLGFAAALWPMAKRLDK